MDKILSRANAEIVKVAMDDEATDEELTGIIEDLRPDLAGLDWQLVDRQIIRIAGNG